MIRYSRVGVIGLALSCLWFSGCLVEPQNPREIFTDRTTLPPELEALANPGLKASQLTTLSHKDPKGRVAVGVIDCGVDYQHPQLFEQIRFQFSGNKLSGAGADMMGFDAFAHPNLINPQFHALTAKAVVDGRLQGVSGDPLTWIFQVQDAFSNQLVAAVKADPVLSASLFGKKITKDSFIVFGVTDYIRRFNAGMTSYQDAKKKGLLINETNKTSDEILKHYGPNEVEDLFSVDWLANSSVGYPAQIAFNYLDNMDHFVEVLQSVYTKLDQQAGITPALARWTQYLNTLNDDGGKKGVSQINQAWYFGRFRQSRVPILTMIESACGYFPKSVKAQLQDPKTTPEQRAVIFKNEYARELGVLIQIQKKRVELGEVGSGDRSQIADWINYSPRYVAMLDELFKTRPYLEKYLDCRDNLAAMAAKDAGLSRYADLHFHPYLSDQSDGETHASHVAGIIARQSKKIDIVPIRVVTASTTYVPDVERRLRQAIESGVAQWSQIPAVNQALQIQAKQILGSGLGQADLVKNFHAFLDKTFKDNYLDYYFFEQINQAIQYVGQNKIKVANMSLGTSFQKAILNPAENDSEKRFKNFFTALVYEYFKYSVATTIEKFAQQTLFVVASGNDGAWIDSQSRSGLPCDLSSPLIGQIQKGKPITEIVPNNRLTNVLCVGSIDKNNNLSSFMNLPLTSVPFVLSFGESILSTIKLSNCDGAGQEVTETYGTNGFLPAPGIEMDDARFDDLLKSSGWYTESPYQDEITKRSQAIQKATMFAWEVSSQIRGAVTQSRCMMQKRPMARMSGTSMATPSVAGYVARMLVAEVNKKGLSESQIWDMPEYSPSSLIKMIKDKSPTFGGESIIKDVTKVIDIKMLSPHQVAKLKQVIGAVSPQQIQAIPAQ